MALLHGKGVSKEAISIFQKALKRYAASPVELDLSKFPQAHENGYSFESCGKLVAAMPSPLWESNHPYEINCFDTVIALAGEGRDSQ